MKVLTGRGVRGLIGSCRAAVECGSSFGRARCGVCPFVGEARIARKHLCAARVSRWGASALERHGVGIYLDIGRTVRHGQHPEAAAHPECANE